MMRSVRLGPVRSTVLQEKNKAIEVEAMQMSWSQPDDSRGVCAKRGEVQKSLKLVPEMRKSKQRAITARLKRNG